MKLEVEILWINDYLQLYNALPSLIVVLQNWNL